MSDALAAALAEIDDPETINRILSAVGNEISNELSDEFDEVDPSTLQEHYERYVDRQQDCRNTTHDQYERTLPPFVEYCRDNGVRHPENLTTGLVDGYVDSLKDVFDSDATILTHTKNIRAWLHWLAKRDHCADTVYRVLDKDELGLSPNKRDEAIPADVAEDILQSLRKQRRGSHLHAVLALTWNTGLRLSGLRALDLQDFAADEAVLRVRHRPVTDTNLKNGSEDDDSPGDSERDIALHPSVVDALREYIRVERHDVSDNYGRDPLFTTAYGRPSKSTLRRWIYAATSCRWHDNQEEENEDCDGSCDPDSDVCPFSYNPHAIRRGAITTHLTGGLRRDRAAERFDVSEPVLRAHYDERTQAEELAAREQEVRKTWNTDW